MKIQRGEYWDIFAEIAKISVKMHSVESLDILEELSLPNYLQLTRINSNFKEKKCVSKNVCLLNLSPPLYFLRGYPYKFSENISLQLLLIYSIGGVKTYW